MAPADGEALSGASDGAAQGVLYLVLGAAAVVVAGGGVGMWLLRRRKPQVEEGD